MKIAESLSPITKKLDETSKKLGDVIKESNTPQPAIENTPQASIENTLAPQPIEANEGKVYDVESENTLNKMADNTGFFKTHYDRKLGWIWNGYPVKMLGGTEVEITKKNLL